MGKTTRRVGLEGVKFNAAIGFFEEERIFKNNFLVDVSVLFVQENATVTEDLSQTVDYSDLYQICKQAFAQETLLMETLAHKILTGIKTFYPFVDEINIKIKKLNPPLKATIKHSYIELNYKK